MSEKITSNGVLFIAAASAALLSTATGLCPAFWRSLTTSGPTVAKPVEGSR